MTNKILISLFSMILIVSVCFSLFGCSSKEGAAKINYVLLSDKEMNSSFLETKTDNKMTLVENNTSNFVIVTIENMDVALERSINELKDIIFKMSNVTLPIVTDTSYENKIILSLENDIAKEDGFKLEIQDSTISIVAKDQASLRNGIYTFIEDNLGAMFITPDDTFIPKHNSIYLEKGVQIIEPKTAWRDVYAYETSQNYWAAKLRLNGIDVTSTDNEVLENREGVTNDNRTKHLLEGRQYTGWGTWCHSYYSFVNPDIYFESHPEYFSYFKGKRICKMGDRDAHLCLSNPEVYDIVEKELGKKIAESPDAMYWDFSVSDTSSVPGCQCKNCKKLDTDAGSGMGSLLPVLNKLAKKYPDKYISTLAYFHTIKPPKNDITIEDNVVIKLCAMPGDQGSSYLNPNNKNAKDFSNRVKEWSKICNKIVIWDYVVDFGNLLLPFPNFAVQQENQKFYEENNIQGIFHQASREKGGELANLRSYILSQLMWKGSSMDVSKMVSKYTQAYYGDAAKYVLQYFNDLANNLSKKGNDLGLYDNLSSHNKDYLSKDNIIKYKETINNALGSVPKDSKYYKRVEELSLNVNFAIASQPKFEEIERNIALNEVNRLCNDTNINMVNEWTSLDDFNKNYDNFIKNELKVINNPRNLAIIIPISVILGFCLIAIIVALIKKMLIK